MMELRVEGDRTALVDTSSIARIVTAPGLGVSEMASVDRPIRLYFRDAGDPLDIINVSVLQMMGNVAIKAHEWGEKNPFRVIFLDAPAQNALVAD
jgi:hypothetical protein